MTNDQGITNLEIGCLVIPWVLGYFVIGYFYNGLPQISVLHSPYCHSCTI